MSSKLWEIFLPGRNKTSKQLIFKKINNRRFLQSLSVQKLPLSAKGIDPDDGVFTRYGEEKI